MPDPNVLPPGELDITDIQRAIGKGAEGEEGWEDELSGLIEAALEVDKRPDYKAGTARSWSGYSPEKSKVRVAGEGGVVELAREPDGNWPPFWWSDSEKYLYDTVDRRELSIPRETLRGQYHKELKTLQDEAARVRGGAFDQYGGPILIGFDGDTPVRPSDNDLGGMGSPDYKRKRIIADMQFTEASYRSKLLGSQQRPFPKATGRVDPTAGPLDLVGFGLGAVRAGAAGVQGLVKSFLKKQRGGQIRQPRLSGSGRMERMGERGPVPMLPASGGRYGVPMHPEAQLKRHWAAYADRDRAWNLSGHSKPGFGYSDPKGYTWRPTPYPGRELARGRPTSAGITPEQYSRRMKDFRQTGGFHPSGPRQYFMNPLTHPKEASLGYWRGGGGGHLSKVSPQELLRRQSMFDRLGYWNTGIPAALATPEMVDQMGELDEYGEVLRMLEQMQPQGE
jgi:hypothetical protein